MPGKSFRGALLVAVLFAISLGGPALAQKKLEGIPLVWKPSNKKSAGVMDLAGLADVKVQVDPFVDTRENKTKFGENQEDKVPRPVTTSGSVADFCTQNFRNALKQYGLTVVPTGGDVVVGGEILEFMVIETNTYKGEVRLKLAVKKGGKAQWAGLAAGNLNPLGPVVQGRELLRDDQRRPARGARRKPSRTRGSARRWPRNRAGAAA